MGHVMASVVCGLLDGVIRLAVLLECWVVVIFLSLSLSLTHTHTQVSIVGTANSLVSVWNFTCT